MNRTNIPECNEHDASHPVIDLTEYWSTYSIGEYYSGIGKGEPLNYNELEDLKSTLLPESYDDSMIPQLEGTFSRLGLVYETETHKNGERALFRVICIVMGFDPDNGVVYIKTSENPSRPLIKVYADLIGNSKLYQFRGELRTFQNFVHSHRSGFILSLGDVVPVELLGDKVFIQIGISFFGFKPRAVAVKLSPTSDTYVMAALVDTDANDREQPYVIRVSADFRIPCIKMAICDGVRWIK